MANEISVSASLAATNGTLIVPTFGGTQQIDQATAGGGGPGFLKIGTSWETIALTDITTPGVCWCKNLDATNYVELGTNDGGGDQEFLKLKAGEYFPFRLSGLTTLRARANSAEVKILLIVLED